MATLIQVRRDTETNWSTYNPILAAGEIAFSTDQNKIKVGNGTSNWSSLPYINATPSEITSQINAAISSVIDSAPGTLDTLNELAAAINDDPTFFTTIATNLSNHESDTTNIHGIANTADLATKSYADSAVSTHNSDTTDVHGISNTANLVYTNDSRLSDARTPVAHTHITSDITNFTEDVQDVIGGMVSTNTESGISVEYNDETGKLNFNVNDPTITLSGDVSGSATMTDLGNVEISTTVADDSHNHTVSTINNFTEEVQDVIGGMVSSNTESGISVSYDDENGKLNFNVSDPTLTFTGDVTGSGTITDLGNTSIEMTIADNSHNHTSSNISDFTEATQDIVGDMVSSNTESGISVTYDDETGKINFDVADPTLTFTGDATGSGTITNLGNTSIELTVADNSHNHTASNISDFVEATQDVIGDMVSSNTESGISVSYDDESGKLNFNVNDPTITLSGDVTGSATMTDLGNVTITTTIASDSVALGNDTTGDYVATISGTENQITVSGAGTEGRAATLSVSSSFVFPGSVTLNAAPTQSLHAATKQYVDEVAEGLKAKPAVEIATTSNLDATYNNGTSGVGATLTANSNGAFPQIDGITLSSTTPGQNGVLVKNQTNSAHNGRYNLTQVGDAETPWILTRCGLCDQSSEIPGIYTFVKTGTLNGGTGWVQTVSNPSTFTIGTDSILVTQFSGSGTYTAGTGLSLTGTQFANTGVLSLAGTENEITVSGSTGNITLSLPATVNADISGNAATVTNGVVTTGSYSDPSWITGLSWSKISSTPTTLSGYGITDAQPVDGDLTAIAALSGTSGLLKKTGADTWTLDTNTYLTGNQTITLSGDVSGSGTTSIEVTIADDSHNHIISNVDGLQDALDAKQPIDADLTAIAALSGTSGLLKKTAADTWTLDTSTYLTSNQSISISGDATGSGTTDITLTLANSGVTANTYGSSSSIPVITVDAKGRVTNVTTSSVEGLPSQTGNSGKYLTTDGTNASWGTLDLSTKADLNSPSFTGSITLDSVSNTDTTSTTISSNIATTIDTINASTYRSAEYLVQVTQGAKQTISKIIMIHDGTTANISEYGLIELGTSRIPLTISATISGSDVLLQATITDASSTNASVKVIKTAIVI